MATSQSLVDYPSLVKELDTFSRNLTDYLKAEEDYNKDPSNKAPEFTDYFTKFEYANLLSAANVTVDANYTDVWATIAEVMKRIEALERETNLAKRVKSDYYPVAETVDTSNILYEKQKTLRQKHVFNTK